jgi:NAD(P)-dependent dehydrogenase (short-subunit alcohol dehydrogenase family)
MDLEIKDKVAVVTAASKGIGLAVARALAAEVATLAALLASPRTANVTGSNVVIDGGLIKTL